MANLTERNSPSVCAIVCIRNELDYLPTLVSHLRQEGLDIAVIDNGSTDGSREFLEARLGSDILMIKDLPFKGSFSLQDQLQAKAEVIGLLEHDWVMHSDADEIIHARASGVTLVDLARMAQEGGFNVVNFEEFVFLPKPGEDAVKLGDHRKILRYYYFAPLPVRLMRMWERRSGLDNQSGGGHSLSGDTKIYPETQILRHYITLSQDHVNKKYIGRVFADSELNRGWHRNRIGLTEHDLSFARIPDTEVSELASPQSRDFDRSKRKAQHFWSWKYTPLVEAETQVRESRRKQKVLNQEIRKLRSLLAAKSQLLEKAKRERDQALWENAELRESASWRLTLPLRKALGAIKSK